MIEKYEQHFPIGQLLRRRCEGVTSYWKVVSAEPIDTAGPRMWYYRLENIRTKKIRPIMLHKVGKKGIDTLRYQLQHIIGYFQLFPPTPKNIEILQKFMNKHKITVV